MRIKFVFGVLIFKKVEQTNNRAKAAVEAKGHHEKDNLWQSFKFRRFKPGSDDEHNPDRHLEWN